MEAALTLPVAALIVFCVLAETTQQTCFKAGSKAIPDGAGPLGPLVQPLIWAGILAWTFEALAWIRVLQHAPLSVAYPMMTLCYVMVPLAGVLFLKERMSLRQMIGAGLIAGGALTIAVTGGVG